MFDEIKGAGTEADPYTIESELDWSNFATRVTNGNNYDGKFIKLIKGGPKEDTLIIYIKTNKKEKGTLVLSFHPSDKPDELIPLF